MIDYTGLSVIATFTDGTTEDITQEVSITPEEGKVFDPDTDTYVEITYSYFGQEFTTSFTLDYVSLVGIAVTTQPTKTSYRPGELYDYTGIVITATFSDQTTEDVTEECVFDPEEGEPFIDSLVEITYTYAGIDFTAYLQLTAISLTGIAVTTLPTKTAYKYGQPYNYAGMVVTATFSDQSTEDVTSSCIITPPAGDPFSDPHVDIVYTYGDFDYSTYLQLTVVTPTQIAVTHMPAKTLFYEAEQFDYTGAVITATYTDSSTADVTSLCTFDPDDGDLVNFPSELTSDIFEDATVSSTMDQLVDQTNDSEAQENLSDQKAAILAANPGYEYVYFETPDVAPPSQSEMETYQEVTKASDGYFHYSISSFVFQNEQTDGTHTYSFVFPNGTINMRNGRPMAICFENGAWTIYNYYPADGRINVIARSVTVTETLPDGTVTTYTGRYKTFSCSRFLSYKGDMRFFSSYSEMVAYFQSLNASDGSTDYGSTYPYHLKVYVEREHWQDPDYTPYVRTEKYSGTIDLWSKYPIYRARRFYDPSVLYPSLADQPFNWGEKMDIAYGIPGKCEMIVQSAICFETGWRGQPTNSGIISHTTVYSSSQGKVPTSISDDQTCITDMFGYGVGSLPGGQRTVDEGSASCIEAALPVPSNMGSIKVVSNGLHFETFDTRTSRDVMYHGRPFYEVCWDQSRYQVLEDNNPYYGFFSEGNYDAWLADMNKSSQEQPVTPRTPKPGKVVAAKVDDTAQYLDSDGNMQYYGPDASIPIYHDNENGMDYIQLYTEVREGDIDTASDTFGGLDPAENKWVNIYFGDTGGGIDGMNHVSTFDIKQGVDVEYEEGPNSYFTSFEVSLRGV